jgi:hypothetical protein
MLTGSTPGWMTTTTTQAIVIAFIAFIAHIMHGAGEHDLRASACSGSGSS